MYNTPRKQQLLEAENSVRGWTEGEREIRETRGGGVGRTGEAELTIRPPSGHGRSRNVLLIPGRSSLHFKRRPWERATATSPTATA